MCPACVNADLPDDEPEAAVYEKGDQSAFDAYFEKAKREGDNFGELLKVLRRVK
jgi:hypothetical protein